ncbi:BlaI family penicillinase repressor [Anaerosolibacter carboniphilus]|uniref:BlaI family penicillinase repressor n=1 Tax=Anaerosolibacter carboniphilus TaxID=1417629 RepID=A0A841L5B7_9FIRM|nr:BlaI/MecI/CopY family transcriptional regulator [Anaerosolibacter carboniphilus]MBB6218302.1 BlaI family penicillinase repressor [Anaerosolibacter carboniphilus]
MKKIPQISDAEWEIMKIVWSNPKITANQVIEMLGDDVTWKPKTVKALINRLLNKGAIGYEKDGRSYLYYPLVSEKDCVKAESESFLNKVFNGSFSLMMANFLEKVELSPEDIEELKQMLDEGKK